MIEHLQNALKEKRSAFLPKRPTLLLDLLQVGLAEEPYHNPSSDAAGLKALFPLTFDRPLLRAVVNRVPKAAKPLRVGVFFSGGQAAGGHNVIAGLYDALKLLHDKSTLIGFLDGPGGVVAGRSRELNAEELHRYRNQGGFDLIGSGRTKIETEEQLQAAHAHVQKLELDGLVVIGGDDSNTNAAVLAEYFQKVGCKTRVIGVPKTIDGDLKNAMVATSFGFDTACKVYAEIIGNIARDALSAQKYYHFIRLMGRSASHIALECALATQPNYTLIGEEVSQEKRTLKQITDEIADLICHRAELGKNFGVILVPEGLIEFIPEMGVLIGELNQILAAQAGASIETVMAKLTPASLACFKTLPEVIQKQLLLNRDPHGNVQVSLIETEKLLIETVSQELAQRAKSGKYKGKFAAQNHFLGYEGRAAFPSNFDCHYCTTLGFIAALLIHHERSGYMCFVEGLTGAPASWRVGALPLTALMRVEMRKGKEKPVIQKGLVDLKGPAFTHFKKQAQKWMLEDNYCFPGPIQFFGDPDLTERIPLTLLLEQG